MRFEENKVGNVLITKVLDERIAADIAMRFKAYLGESIDKGNSTIVVDLTAVTFIDAIGLSALVATLRSVGNGGDLVISGARSTVASMFKLTRIDRVLRMYPTSDAAMVALS